MVLLLGIGLFGCGEATTIVDVDLLADPCVLALAERLEVRVLNGSGDLLETFDGAAAFPTGVRLSAGEPMDEWRVEAILYDANDLPLTDLSAQGTFQNSVVSRRFEDACLGIVCGNGESCSGGLCLSEEGFTSPAAALAPSVCPAWLFVSTEGSDADGCGSFEAPCASLSALTDSDGPLSPGGGVVHVAPGTYNGSTRLRRDYNGPVVVRGLPGSDAPVFDAQDEERDVFAVEGSDMTFQDLALRGGTEHGISVNVTMTMRQERIRIRRCDLRNNGSRFSMMPDDFNNKSGVHFNNDVGDFIVEDSYFQDNDGPGTFLVYGIYVNKASEGLLRRNRFVSNRSGGVFIADSINVEVRDSVFLSNGPHGVEIRQVASTHLEGNRFCDHSEAGIHSSSELPTEVVRNTFAGNAVGIVRLSPNGGMLDYDRNVFLSQSGPAVEFQTSAAIRPNDGINLYFDNGSVTEGFERSAPEDDIEADPMLSGLDECALMRANADPYPEFGAL